MDGASTCLGLDLLRRPQRNWSRIDIKCLALWPQRLRQLAKAGPFLVGIGRAESEQRMRHSLYRSRRVKICQNRLEVLEGTRHDKAHT